MFLTMGVQLYTSRVVLNALGAEDFGIYSVVGGIVVMFSFFNAAMSTATQRFLAIDIGKGDTEQLSRTFNATMIIHFGIALAILVLSETVGLWFLNTQLNFSETRSTAVFWVYQFSVLTFLISVLQVPYNALIISREQMNVYALLSIVEVVLKMGIVVLLLVLNTDKLILYAGLVLLVTVLIAISYRVYCSRNFAESKFKWYYEKEYFGTLLSYSGWSLFGNLAAVARGQGINILLNIFFGTLLNAAYGVMLQVQTAVNTFVLNFQMAINPQIFKSFAEGNTSKMHMLMTQGAKFSYFLIFILASPIMLNLDFILALWLKEPPEYTSLFINLCLVFLMIETVSGPLIIGVQATGKIKWYQIILGTFIFLNFPITYITYKYYPQPELFLYISIIISAISLIFRVFYLQMLVSFSVKDFFRRVILPILIVTIISGFLTYFLNYKIDNFISFCIKSLIIIVVNLLVIWLFGIFKDEKVRILSFLSNKFKKRIH